MKKAVLSLGMLTVCVINCSQYNPDEKHQHRDSVVGNFFSPIRVPNYQPMKLVGWEPKNHNLFSKTTEQAISTEGKQEEQDAPEASSDSLRQDFLKKLAIATAIINSQPFPHFTDSEMRSGALLSRDPYSSSHHWEFGDGI